MIMGMYFRLFLPAFLLVGAVTPGHGQVARINRFDILGTLIADNAAARIAMPFGTEGVRLSENGTIDEVKLLEELQKRGRSISAGQVVAVTGINFDDNQIEVELDGGGKSETGILDRIQVNMGGVRLDQPAGEAKGSKVVLLFEDKVPASLTADDLKALLSPVLDFDKQNFMDSGIESLPEAFREAVVASEAMIGMDRSTVLMAKGRPDDKVWETVDGIEREDWIYYKRGLGADFITFEGDIVVRIIRH